MNRIISISFSLFFLITLNACYQNLDSSDQFHDEFFLRHKGADLPIWIRGNAESKTLIVFLHGGPFQTAIEEAVLGSLDLIHEDYAVLYFDQRGGGFTDGNISELISEEQFAEDVKIVTELAKEKYPQFENYFLMGHSWGGYLGTLFLATDSNQNMYDGWISVAGVPNFPLNWLESRSFSMNWIEENIENNTITAADWEPLLNTLIETPAINSREELLNINYVAQQINNELAKETETLASIPFLEFLSSPVGTGFQQKNNALFTEVLVNGNLDDEMTTITLPSLNLYAAKDPIVPTTLGEHAMETLGTLAEDKYLIIFENSTHSIFKDERQKFKEELSWFIEKYK